MREGNRRERLSLAAALAAASVGIGLASSRGPGRELDRRAFHAMNRARRGPADAFMQGVTELGSIFGSIGAAAALSVAGRRMVAGRALAAAGATWVAGQLLKRAFMRPRPYDAFQGESRLLIGKPHGTSWPSSHPAVLLAFCTVAERGLELPMGARRGLLVVAGAVGASRIVLGVHFPSDVASGLLIGRAVGLVWPSENERRR